MNARGVLSLLFFFVCTATDDEVMDAPFNCWKITLSGVCSVDFIAKRTSNSSREEGKKWVKT